jgi:GNAT superfamily N-acetyltransferase
LGFIIVTQLGGDDWQVWRDLRIAALAADPDAFGVSVEGTYDLDESDWREMLDPELGMKAVAFAGPRPVGLIAVWLPDGPGETAEAHSLWVEPEFRRHGVARLLFAEWGAWAVRHRCTALSGWVVERNDKARAAHVRMGLQFIDEYKPHPYESGARLQRVTYPIPKNWLQLAGPDA